MAILYLVLSVSGSVTRFEDAQIAKRNLLFVQDRIAVRIKNPATYLKILEGATAAGNCNRTLTCLALKEDCGLAPYTTQVDRNNFSQEITCIFETDGSKIFDKDIPTNGFGVNGENCNTYPSQQCPFRPKISWKPLCPSYDSCLSPPVEYKVEMEITDIGTAINPNRRVSRGIIQ